MKVILYVIGYIYGYIKIRCVLLFMKQLNNKIYSFRKELNKRRKKETEINVKEENLLRLF